MLIDELFKMLMLGLISLCLLIIFLGGLVWIGASTVDAVERIKQRRQKVQRDEGLTKLELERKQLDLDLYEAVSWAKVEQYRQNLSEPKPR